MTKASECCSHSVPQSTLAVLARLPIGQTENVLTMLAASPETANLIETNTGMSVCLGAAFTFAQKAGLNPEVDWVYQKRRTTCRRLGFPDEERTVRLLAKVRPECAAAWRLRRIREPLHQQALAKLLSHLPIIHDGHLVVAANLWDAHVISRSMFRELATWRSERAVEGFCAMVSDTVWLHRFVGTRNPVFRSIAQLMNSHDRMVKAAGRAGPSDADPMLLPYPLSPLQVPIGIEPITSPLDLKEEGRVMEHCVFHYSRDVALGRRYFYRQATPDRVTIGVINRGGKWAVFDVRMQRDEQVSDELADSVSTWVEQAQSGAQG